MTSTEYYRTHKKARKKKQRYDAKLNARPEMVQKRVESNAKQREARRKGINTDGRDWDHHTRSFQPVRVNRGRRGEGNR